MDVRSGVSRWPAPFPHIPGTEFAGEVSATGPGTSLGVGDRVVAFEGTCGACEYCRSERDNLCTAAQHFGLTIAGGYAQFVRAPETALFKLDDKLSYEAAATAQLSFGTSYHMLVTRAQLKRGETVLVNAAASSVGTAAVQIAKWLGAHVIASAGSPAKLEALRALGADDVIDYSHEALDEAVLGLTNGRGVDVVFEHVGGEMLQHALRATARDGRVVTCGAHAGEVVPIDIIPFFRRQLSLLGSRRVTSAELREVLRLMGEGIFKPAIHKRLPLSAAREAHELIERRENIGKVILLP
jgi:NADPH:quinone reductase-like Zn-dependent oxidoreductase